VERVGDKLTLKNKRYEGDERESVLRIVPTDYHDIYELEAAESEIMVHYEAVAEEARLEAVRKAARAKLSDEEAQALGLK
jgi:hypothetical protein